MTDEEKAEEYAKQIKRLEEDKEQIIFESDLKIKALEGMIEELEEEREQLKKQEEILLDRILSLQKTNGSLTDKVEKMQCCGNCKHYTQKSNYLLGICKERYNVEGNNICKEWELAE